MHDPKALLEARLWLKEKYCFKLGDLKSVDVDLGVGGPPVPFLGYGDGEKKMRGDDFYERPDEGQRPQACVGCHAGCRARYDFHLVLLVHV